MSELKWRSAAMVELHTTAEQFYKLPFRVYQPIEQYCIRRVTGRKASDPTVMVFRMPKYKAEEMEAMITGGTK